MIAPIIHVVHVVIEVIVKACSHWLCVVVLEGEVIRVAELPQDLPCGLVSAPLNEQLVQKQKPCVQLKLLSVITSGHRSVRAQFFCFV